MQPTPRPDAPHRPTPWKNPPACVGEFAIIDIDGVLAAMEEFEPLLHTARSKDRDWYAFHRSFGLARQIKSGRKLIESLRSVDVHVAYSTTRPEQFARATWNWLDRHHLPLGPIQFRHLIKDGSRPMDQVKVRHWWNWHDTYDLDHRLVAWFDDSQTASNLLRANGCPAWSPKEFLRRVRAAGGTTDAVTSVLEEGPIDMRVLEEREVAARGPWQEQEDTWQAKQQEWFQEHQARMRERNRRRP